MTEPNNSVPFFQVLELADVSLPAERQEDFIRSAVGIHELIASLRATPLGETSPSFAFRAEQ